MVNKCASAAAHRRVLTCLTWLLLASALGTLGQDIPRRSTQADGSNTDDFTKVVDDTGWRPFLALKNPTTARSADVQRLYEQSGLASAIAYLLFAAANALSEAIGSSNAVLPYLNPTVVRLYTSQPKRCSSPVAQLLYNLAESLYGTPELQACHYDLYTALGTTFAWVRDNIALRAQEVPGQPLATAMWPDLDLYSELELSAAVAAALADPDKLGETAALVETSCGLSQLELAALVPDISTALEQLHADLPMLQSLAEELHATRWSPSDPEDSARRRVALEEWKDPHARTEATGPEGGVDDGADKQNRAGCDASALCLEESVHRRSALTLPSNFYYSLPPSNFVVQPPARMPQLLIPMIFHIMLYTDSSSMGPVKYDKAPVFVQRLVDVANTMAKPTGIQLFVKEVRNNPTTYPYLLLSDRTTWLKIPMSNCTGGYCFSSSRFMYNNVWDFPRSMNVFVASDSTAGVPLGYAYVPGSDLYPNNGHIFVSWDSLLTDGANSLTSYDDGPNTLLHEVFHHLGLEHPFDSSVDTKGNCVDGDYVIDTPASLRPISSSSFFATAQAYCMELFWGQYGGDWEAAYNRWSTNLGIPEGDMNAWADSCPALAGYDELGNYMTYNTPVCFAALGHFTPAQAQRAMLLTAELNPVMYAWGQYYAQTAAPPPAQSPPPPEFVNNTCRSTARSACPCKSSWTLNGIAYSYCDRTGTNSTLTCEVQDPSSCADCPALATQCVLACAGSARICKRPPAPGTRMPPPPPPRPPSPPPMPPPPPPRSVPSDCKRSRSGCECRSTWSYTIRGITGFYSYCASPDNDTNLWCQISSTCPNFNNSNPLQYCLPNLTTSYCGGQVYFTTTRVPPRPPAPPPNYNPSPPPSPPAPLAGPIATITGTFSINADCTLLTTSAADLRSGVLSELSQVLQVPSSYISLLSLSCGSIIVTYQVAFPQGVTVEQINSVTAAVNSFSSSVSSSFTGRWGAVTQSSSTAVDVSSLCSSGACPPFTARPPPPPSSTSSTKSSFPWIWIVISFAGVSVISSIIVIVAVVLTVKRKRRDAVVAPEPPGATQPPPPQPLGTWAVRTPPAVGPSYGY